MSVPRSFPVFAVVFAAVYAVAYIVCVMKNYALFTYDPSLGEFSAGVHKPKEGEAMYWYGWMATSGIAAGLVAFAACWLPESLTRRLWSGWSWAVPLVVMLLFCYLLRGYFLR
jgi:hypothetical protein